MGVKSSSSSSDEPRATNHESRITNHEPRATNHEPRASLVLQFLPDFALWPGLKLGVNVVFDDGTTKYAAVPRSDSNLGEADRIRNQAVQDNFIRVEVPVPALAKSVKIAAVDPGVVVDRVGVRSLSNTEKKGGVK